MSVLRGIRSLVLGETWALPLAVAGLAAAALLAHALVPVLWRDAGPAALALGVVLVLVLTVRGSARR